MLWKCVKCTAKYAVGLLRCPHCKHTEYQEAPGGEVAEDAPVLTTAGHEVAAAETSVEADEAAAEVSAETVPAKPKAAKKPAPPVDETLAEAAPTTTGEGA